MMTAEGVRLCKAADKGIVFRECLQHIPGPVISPEIDSLAAGKFICQTEDRQKLPVIGRKRIQKDMKDHVINAGVVFDEPSFREVGCQIQINTGKPALREMVQSRKRRGIQLQIAERTVIFQLFRPET